MKSAKPRYRIKALITAALVLVSALSCFSITVSAAPTVKTATITFTASELGGTKTANGGEETSKAEGNNAEAMWLNPGINGTPVKNFQFDFTAPWNSGRAKIVAKLSDIVSGETGTQPNIVPDSIRIKSVTYNYTVSAASTNSSVESIEITVNNYFEGYNGNTIEGVSPENVNSDGSLDSALIKTVTGTNSVSETLTVTLAASQTSFANLAGSQITPCAVFKDNGGSAVTIAATETLSMTVNSASITVEYLADLPLSASGTQTLSLGADKVDPGAPVQIGVPHSVSSGDDNWDHVVFYDWGWNYDNINALAAVYNSISFELYVDSVEGSAYVIPFVEEYENHAFPGPSQPLTAGRNTITYNFSNIRGADGTTEITAVALFICSNSSATVTLGNPPAPAAVTPVRPQRPSDSNNSSGGWSDLSNMPVVSNTPQIGPATGASGSSSAAPVVSNKPVTSEQAASMVGESKKSNITYNAEKAGVTDDILQAFAGNKKAKVLVAQTDDVTLKISKTDISDPKALEGIDLTKEKGDVLSSKQIKNSSVLKDSKDIIQLKFKSSGKFKGLSKVMLQAKSDKKLKNHKVVIYEKTGGKLKKIGTAKVKKDGTIAFNANHLGQFIISVK